MPDIVLTDIKMPGLDGIGLLRAHQSGAAGDRSHHDHRPRRCGSRHREPQARGDRLRHQAHQRRRAGDRPEAGAGTHRHAPAAAGNTPKTWRSGSKHRPNAWWKWSGWPPSARPSKGFPRPSATWRATSKAACASSTRCPASCRPRPQPHGGGHQRALPGAPGRHGRPPQLGDLRRPGEDPAAAPARWRRPCAPARASAARRPSFTGDGSRHPAMVHTVPDPQRPGGVWSWCSSSRWTSPRWNGCAKSCARLRTGWPLSGLMVSSVSHGIKGILTGLDAGVYLMTESGTPQIRTSSQARDGVWPRSRRWSERHPVR